VVAFINRNPLPNLDTLQVRAEDWSIADRYDVVTGRALAPLAVQLELSSKPCKLGGFVIPMRTPADFPEMERLTSVLGLELMRIDRRMLPGLDVERVFPVYKKVRRTPAPHPRPWAEIKRNPI
jgi:16S rRNA (guanine527-N7)-methyltransferase